jgi:hypothetical protein
MVLMHFNPEIAKLIGVDEAIMLENIHYWVKRNMANGKNIVNGKAWTYNSMNAFTVIFPFWSEKQIRRILKSLKDHELIETGCFNKHKRDKTLWYTVSQTGMTLFPNRELHLPKRANGLDQMGECTSAQMGEPLPFLNLPDINLSKTLSKEENVFSDFENEKEKPENQTHSLNENGSVASSTFKNAPPPKKPNPDLFVEHAEAMRDFWEAYPKATKRRPMENAFLQEIQYEGVTPERLVERAKAYAQKVKHEEIDPRFIPDPYKWLENGQYDDRTLDEFMNRPVTAKEKNAGLLEHEILLNEKTLYHKPSGRLIETEGAEAKKTQYGFYVMRFADGLIAHLGHLDIPHPSLLKGA